MATTPTKNIKNLPVATSFNAGDVAHISQNGVDKQIQSTTILEQLNSGQPFRPNVLTESSTTRTLTAADKAAYISCTNSLTTTITVSSVADSDWRLGEVITVHKEAAGDVVFQGASGVTVNPSVSGLTLSEVGQVGTLLYKGNNIWDFLTGGSAATSIQGAITFDTVVSLKTGATIEGGSIIDWSDYLGRKVSTVVSNTTSNEGGAQYVIVNVNPNNLSTLVSGIWVGANHDLGGGFYAKLIDTPTMSNVGASFVGDQIAAFSALHAVSERITSSRDFELNTRYTASTPIIIDGSYSITTKGTLDYVILANDELTWIGVKPIVDPLASISSAFVFSTSKLPKFYSFEIGQMQTENFFSSSGSTSSADVTTLTGDFVARDITMEVGSKSNWLFKLVGNTGWDKTNSTAPTASFENCKIRGDQFYYTAKGFRFVSVDNCEFEWDEYRESVKNWYSQDVGLTDWSVNDAGFVTINGGQVTTTAGLNGIISDSSDLLTSGETYRLSLSVDFDSGTTFSIYETNSSGALLVSGLGSGVHNIEFTAATNCRIYIRFDTASVVNFEMVQVIAKPPSDVRGSATFDTFTHQITNSIFKGGERGPTLGIDTFNGYIDGNKIFDVWNRAIALDTERFSPPSWDSAYPDSRVIVTNNQGFNCGRLIYSTCRNAKITDNTGFNCSPSGSHTGTPAAMRFNSANRGFNTDAEIEVGRNTFIGCGGNPIISANSGTSIVHYDNFHDATTSYPVRVSSGVYRYPKAHLAPKTASFTLDTSMPVVYVQYATTGTFLEISVPNLDNLRAYGYEFTIIFVGTVGDVRLKGLTSKASINGSTLLVIPTNTKICKVVNTNSTCDHLAVFLN